MRLTLLVVIFGVALAGVTVAFAQQDYVSGYESRSTEATPSQSPPPPLPPISKPCLFGPITKRITWDDLFAIIRESSTRREAWYAILARPEDEDAEPLPFGLKAPDDGLRDGLVCPGETP
jgi:hypothetical protein